MQSRQGREVSRERLLATATRDRRGPDEN